MTGIIIALYEEFLPLKYELSFYRVDGVGQYNGFLAGKPVSVCLCGAGLRHRKKLSKWLEQYRFSHIVNIGFAGALSKSLKLGQECVVKTILQKQGRPLDLSVEEGELLITVDKPVFSYDEKEDIFLSEKAVLVDMEAYKIAEVISMSKKTDLSFFFVLKIVGDIPGDALYLRKEASFRPFFTRRSMFDRLKIILKTGLKNSLFLYQRKKFLQRRLYETLDQFFMTQAFSAKPHRYSANSIQTQG